MQISATTTAANSESSKVALPEMLRPLFWDHDFESLRWSGHRDLIVSRVLASGPWKVIHWLRQRLDNDQLANRIRAHRGRGLSPPQLRFWQLILDLPDREVDKWLAARRPAVWDRRVAR